MAPQSEGYLFKTDLPTAKAVLKAALHCWRRFGKDGLMEPSLRTFVTISRQPGAGGFSFAQRLAKRLNALQNGDWTVWDNELFDKVWAEKSVEEEVMQVLQEQPSAWLNDLLKQAADHHVGRHSEEFAAYQRVAMMLGSLALAGHAVLVGRGGQYITDQMSGGIHLRLVAPLEHRIKFMADTYHLTPSQAESRVAQIEHDRNRFYHLHWPNRSLGPEIFAMTLNSGELSLDEMVESIVPLIQMRETERNAGLSFRPSRSHATAKCC